MNNAQKEYPKGNEELLALIEKIPFDSARALEIIKGIENIDEVIVDFSWLKSGITTTYLERACGVSNLEAVRVLLDNGADPNFDDEEENICPFWDLMYPEIFAKDYSGDRTEDEVNAARLEIVKLFLEHGANPNMKPSSESETLYEWAVYRTYENYDYGDAYLRLMESYGGKMRNH